MKSTRRTRTKKVETAWHEGKVLDGLEAQYSDHDKGIFLRHVPDATSMNKTRTADGMYMGCWQSVGIQLHGFEVKVSRSDWLREIQDISKAGAFERYCHFWWVVAPANVVEIAEMPAQWGLKVVSQNEDGSFGVTVKKAASRNDGATLDYKFFAAALRNCRKSCPVEAELDKIRHEAFEQGRKRGLESNTNDWELKRINKKVDEYLAKIREFEAASGIKIDSWHHQPKEVGAAVAHVLRHGIGQHGHLMQIVDLCHRITAMTQAAIRIQSNVVDCGEGI